MSNRIMTFNFGNKTTARIVVWLEPWAEEIPVDPGSELVLKIHHEDIDTMETEQTAEFSSFGSGAGVGPKFSSMGKIERSRQ